jgi:hypothetical protein
MFPAQYQGGIFVAAHGSWNRTKPSGALINFVSLKADGTADKSIVFAEGWLDENGIYRGRPVDVAMMKDARCSSATTSPARSTGSATRSKASFSRVAGGVALAVAAAFVLTAASSPALADAADGANQGADVRAVSWRQWAGRGAEHAAPRRTAGALSR